MTHAAGSIPHWHWMEGMRWRRMKDGACIASGLVVGASDLDAPPLGWVTIYSGGVLSNVPVSDLDDCEPVVNHQMIGCLLELVRRSIPDCVMVSFEPFDGMCPDLGGVRAWAHYRGQRWELIGDRHPNNFDETMFRALGWKPVPPADDDLVLLKLIPKVPLL